MGGISSAIATPMSDDGRRDVDLLCVVVLSVDAARRVDSSMHRASAAQPPAAQQECVF